jgi:hypothetical protein
MRTLMIVILAAVLLTQTVSAQSAGRTSVVSPQKIEYAKKNILFGLASGNEGITESVMVLTAKIVLMAPQTDLTEIRTHIERIASAHASGTLRYKAFILMQILEDPERFADVDTLRGLEPEAFFIAVARQLQRQLLAADPV